MKIHLRKRPIVVASSIGGILLMLIALFLLDEFVVQDAGIIPSKDISITEYRENTNKSYEIYKQWATIEHQRVFDWHLRSTKIIFWVSILVAIIGMGLSFWQFMEASNESERASDADELELKTKLVSLAFKSRSVAALIMFMSIAYLLIYVLLVYPIRYTPQSPLSAEATGSGAHTSSNETNESVVPSFPIDKKDGSNREEK